MISYKRLPGSNKQLDGLMDVIDFDKYWNAFKYKIKDLYDLGPKITQYWARISNAQQILVSRGDTQRAALLDNEMKKIADDLQKWSRVKGYLDQWVPTFMSIEKQQNAEKGLGVIPALILGVSGIFALTAIVNNGMALLQDYQFKSNLTAEMIAGKITSGQYRDIISVPKEEGVFEKVVSTVGVSAAFGIPTALVVAGGLYLLFTTGMLNTLLKTVGLRDSPQSSGG